MKNENENFNAPLATFAPFAPFADFVALMAFGAFAPLAGLSVLGALGAFSALAAFSDFWGFGASADCIFSIKVSSFKLFSRTSTSCVGEAAGASTIFPELTSPALGIFALALLDRATALGETGFGSFFAAGAFLVTEGEDILVVLVIPRGEIELLLTETSRDQED